MKKSIAELLAMGSSISDKEQQRIEDEAFERETDWTEEEAMKRLPPSYMWSEAVTIPQLTDEEAKAIFELADNDKPLH